MVFVIGSLAVAVLGGVVICWLVARVRGTNSLVPAVVMLCFGLAMVFLSTLVEQTEIGRWGGVTESFARGSDWCVRYVPPTDEGGVRVECRSSEDAAWRWADRYTAELEEQYGPSTRRPEGWALVIGLYGWALAGCGVLWLVVRLFRRGRATTVTPKS